MSSISTLKPSDLDAFRRLRIPPELLKTAAVCRVTDVQARENWGIRFDPGADLSGIIFPFFDPVTGHRVTALLRRDHPDLDTEGNPHAKYLPPWGANRTHYITPGAAALLADPTIPVVFVEAVKSALALTALASRSGRSLLAVATGGCWS